MMPNGLRYRSYRWRDADEWLVEVGRETDPSVLILPPLFEEMNRCRALITGIMRRLAERDVHAILPDLPGTGESPRDLREIDWDDWSGAASLLARDDAKDRRPVMVASVRGGVLLEPTGELPTWRFAPAGGSAVARDLIRARQAAHPTARPKAAAIEAAARTAPIEFAGYTIPPALWARFADVPVPAGGERTRTVRLATDGADADLHLEGKPLWRQAEPGNDRLLAVALASDMADWIHSCAG